MQDFTFSKFLFIASLLLLAWTTVAQGAPINIERGPNDIVNFAKNGLLRRVDSPVDDLWYTLAASRREETLAERDDDLSRRVNVPAEDTWYTALELSAAAGRDLPRRQTAENTNAWYAPSDTGTGTSTGTEGDDPGRKVFTPGEDRDLWYTLSAGSEETEEPSE